jgi:hypothetical protein
MISRRNLIAAATATVAAAKPRRLAEYGWVWDGQGFNGGVNPSIFGTGEGAEYFGIPRVCSMFHPNNTLAAEKLKSFNEVVFEISKWKARRCDNGVAHTLDGKLQTKTEEAAAVSALAARYKNITGAIDDDLMGVIKREKLAPSAYAAVPAALKRAGSRMKLWTVVYTRELIAADWQGFQSSADIIHLYESDPRKMPELDGALELCGRIFPGKPIVLGCYLRDFRARAGMPHDMLELQWNKVARWVADGAIAGYAVLGGFLIDQHEPEARWVRDFIKAH